MADSGDSGDSDWISRRWQGEGRVVNRDLERAMQRQQQKQQTRLRPSGEGGDALMPDVGLHCAKCRRLDFLPAACDCCAATFCGDCIAYDEHDCPARYTKSRVAAVCPLCNEVVPTTGGVPADVAVEKHIAGGCRPMQRTSSYDDRACSYGKCKRRELVKCVCKQCNQNFCFKHRAIGDHKCGQIRRPRRPSSSSSAAAVRRPAASVAQSRRPGVAAAAAAAERRAAASTVPQPQPARPQLATAQVAQSSALGPSAAKQQLVGMGFDAEQAEIALAACGGDANAAVIWLLNQQQRAEQQLQGQSTQAQCVVG